MADTIVKALLNKVLYNRARVLFNNPSQAMSGAITLSESAANYKMLVICFKTNDNFYGSATVYNPNGKTVALTSSGMNALAAYLKIKMVTISGTNINTYYNGTVYYTGETRVDGSNSQTIGDYIAITQVIGYKEFLGGGVLLSPIFRHRKVVAVC